MFPPASLLVGLLRDHRFDTSAAEISADDAVGVGLIGDDRIRTGPRPPRSESRYPNIVDDIGEDRAVVALTPGEHDRQRHPVGVYGGM